MDGLMEERYSRQIRFSRIGRDGQARLRSSRVAIVGLGALGTVITNHLARAGIGYLRLIDRDFVEMSNLTRQMLFDESDAEQTLPKVIAAANKVRMINSEIELDTHIVHLDERNAERLLGDVDVIMDGTDNLTTRYLINDVSHKFDIPWIYGAVIQSRGAALPILPGGTPCLRCIMPTAAKIDPFETCDTVGVLGTAVAIVASYQVTEAIKILIGDVESIQRKLMQIDLWNNQIHTIDLAEAKDDNCPCCSLGQYHYLQLALEFTRMHTMCGRTSIQIQPEAPSSLSLEDWELRLQSHGVVERTPFLLKLTVTDRLKLILFPDGRVIIQGTDNMETAEKLYHFYFHK